jgi:hypothetical protein
MLHTCFVTQNFSLNKIEAFAVSLRSGFRSGILEKPYKVSAYETTTKLS